MKVYLSPAGELFCGFWADNLKKFVIEHPHKPGAITTVNVVDFYLDGWQGLGDL